MKNTVKTEIEGLECQLCALGKDATAHALGSAWAIRDACLKIGQNDAGAVFDRLVGALATHALANDWVSLPKSSLN